MQSYFVHMYTIAFNMTVCSCHILYSWKNYTEFTENVPRIQSLYNLQILMLGLL